MRDNGDRTETDRTGRSRPPLDLANLNQILFAEDLALIFRISAKQAGQNLADGVYGARVQVGRRFAILREELLRHLEERSELPDEPRQASPTANDKATKLIWNQQKGRPD